ncbi:MAG: M1 family aminopeptidase [Bacteroidota bacterium]
MKKKFLSASLIIFFIFTVINIKAQSTLTKKGSWYCHQKKINAKQLPFKSQNTPSHSFDVIKYTLNLNLFSCHTSPYPHSFTGYEIVKFKVDSTLNLIKLNAVNSSLTIDSVSLAGAAFTHSSDILTITLDNAYFAGDTVEVKIWYKHKNVSDNAFYTGNGFAYTDSEPERARFWFPCWDRPSDKAMTDITAKVRHTVLLASNGRLEDSTHVADTIWYRWISDDPVATYLTVITSKLNYNLDVLYWPKISNPSIKIPIRFYYSSGEDPSPSEDVILDMTTYYSTIFGEHPFEKNGFCSLDQQFMWGGMENQTLTSFCQGCWDEYLTAHEYAHQWFGDMVTCGTWADIWINEGWATFTEALWSEHTMGYTQYKADIDADADYYLNNNPGWAISEPSWAVNTPSMSELFDYAVTYCKGACILHMYRYVIGDALFFSSIKSYATDSVEFKYKNAVIPDFITKMNQETGQTLDWFFNEWLYQPNHPVYANTYYIDDIGGGQWNVNFTANQVQTNAGFFKMPLELKINFSNATDTIITVMNDTNHQPFNFIFSLQPVSLEFDPDNEIVLKEGSTTVDIDDISVPVENFFIYPNPANNLVTISSSQKFSKIEISDVNGNIIYNSINRNNSEASVDFSKQAKGVYFVKVYFEDKTEIKKLILF